MHSEHNDSSTTFDRRWMFSAPVWFQVAQLQAETPTDGPKTEALPPARKEGDLPPLWWQFVTRPRERPM